jgi:hypothetical protein
MARATILERRLGAKRHLLELPGTRWHYFALSEVALEFRLKPIKHLVELVNDLARDGYIEVRDSPILHGELHEATLVDLRVTERGKKYLALVPRDAVRASSECLEGVWPRKPSKYHHIPNYVGL